MKSELKFGQTYTSKNNTVLLFICLWSAFTMPFFANAADLELEFWFKAENRDEIQKLHAHLKTRKEVDFGAYDYTTVWNVWQKGYLFEDLEVVRVLTESKENGPMGCCYNHGAGLGLQIEPEVDLSAIQKKYGCFQIENSVAIQGLYFHNHVIPGKKYVELRCRTLN